MKIKNPDYTDRRRDEKSGPDWRIDGCSRRIFPRFTIMRFITTFAKHCRPTRPHFLKQLSSMLSFDPTRLLGSACSCVLLLTPAIKASDHFADWISGYPEVGELTDITDDPDGDGKSNGVENFLGTDPSVPSPGFGSVKLGEGNYTFSLSRNPTPARDLSFSYSWSKDLKNFYASGSTDAEGTQVDISTHEDTPAADTTTVTTTISGTPADTLFVRLEVIQDTISNISIDTVYFAQTHVWEPDHPLFKLVSDREALIKAHIVAPGSESAPEVTAVLSLKGTTHTLPLSGPSVLPLSIPNGPGIVQHSFEDSFTAVVPKEWIQPGLTVTIKAAEKEQVLDNLTIGAPNKLVMNMYDLHFFSPRAGDYPAGWEEEFSAKLPIAELEIRRVPDIVLSEIVVLPTGGFPALRISSSSEYRAITGRSYTEGRTEGKDWMKALRDASGKLGQSKLYYGNVYGAGGGGLASIGGLFAAGDGTNAGVLLHEVGHTFRLPHWAETNTYPYWRPLGYPYQGTMYGISPRPGNAVHTGPTWAFDLPRRTFLPPTARVGSPSAGYFQKDPMQGGGLSNGDQPAGFLLNFFSDYSTWYIMDHLEKNLVQWNSTMNQYTIWDARTGDYTKIVSNYLPGLQPTLEEKEVYSVLAGVSAVTPEGNIVYPPMGPYLSGTTELYDPSEVKDRIRAGFANYAPSGGCDVTLRIVQGGQTKFYMLPVSWDTSLDPLKANSYKLKALNIPAEDGIITELQLLLTPDAQTQGLPPTPEVLYTWSQP
jgi:hypothetical protein